jgi:DnaJ-class molecular chaperone
MSGKCGRCRGRGSVKSAVGFEMALCPDCDGRGVRTKTSSLGKRTVTVPLPPGARCIVCNDPAIATHHLVPQSRINRYVAASLCRTAKADARNGVPVCHTCHGALDSETLQLGERYLPEGFWAFVEQYDLYAGLPRYLMERVA